uniref:Mitochondrial ribosome associated GTPase 2 n=1 Tax=Salmo trutta TaxID=8032 RepID=A0A674A905_SALTR
MASIKSFSLRKRGRLAGGKGACTFHSEPRKEWGGPDGGNGGDGGNIIKSGEGQTECCVWCFGTMPVPVGTVVKEQGETMADLSQHSQEYVAVFGGAGEKGNRARRVVLQLELRSMTHAGLVGFPNAGKSSLLWTISNARPAVATYPFTTLNPTSVDHAVYHPSLSHCLVADIPGIIHGAHLNRGLGISFLHHVECCRFLLFVLDLSSPEPWTQLQHLRFELDQYEGHMELIIHLRELYDVYLQTQGQVVGL